MCKRREIEKIRYIFKYIKDSIIIQEYEYLFLESTRGKGWMKLKQVIIALLVAVF